MKQAGRVWGITLCRVLSTLGFERIKSDASLFVFAKGGVRIIMPVYTDDITIASTFAAESNRVVQELSQHFKLRDLGPTSWLLGIEITRDCPNRSLSLSQRQYILDILETYGFSDCFTVLTPMVPNTHLSTKDCPTTPEASAAMSHIPYINAVGSLMYLATSTHPDIHSLSPSWLASTRTLGLRTGPLSSTCCDI